MATTERRVESADRYLARQLPGIGDELREARVSAGASLERISDLVGFSRRRLARIEQGQVPTVTVRDLARVAAVVGLQASVRLYPGGPPIRDAAHVALLERLRVAISPSLGWRVEVPLPGRATGGPSTR